MTQPIRTFKNLETQATPAGGNSNWHLSFDERRALEVQARAARAEMLVDGLLEGFAWIGRQWQSLVEAIRADLKLRAAEKELYRMSDRELADLGLSRSDIPFAVRKVHGIAPDLHGFEHGAAAANQNLRRAA